MKNFSHQYKFCAECGKQGSVKQLSATQAQCTACGMNFWNNPTGAVAVLFMRDGKLLYSIRGIEPNKGKYDFPGGFLEYNEHPADAAVREIREETGVVIQRPEAFYINSHEYFPGVSVVDIVFVVQEWDGEFKAEDDVADLVWDDISVIDSERFAWDYPGLTSKLQQLITDK